MPSAVKGLTVVCGKQHGDSPLIFFKQGVKAAFAAFSLKKTYGQLLYLCS